MFDVGGECLLRPQGGGGAGHAALHQLRLHAVLHGVDLFGRAGQHEGQPAKRPLGMYRIGLQTLGHAALGGTETQQARGG